MRITPKTPHRRVVAYLLFWAGTVDAAIERLRHHQLDYVYPRIELLKADLAQMRQTMPKWLRVWHEALDPDQLLPPPGCGFEPWAARWEILEFYEQLMVRTPELRDDAFHNAWNLLAAPQQRHIAEGLRVAQLQPAIILEWMNKMNLPIHAMGLDKYFSLFFSLEELGPRDVDFWIQTLGEMAQRDQNYVLEATSKRHAQHHPFDLAGVCYRLGSNIALSQKAMLNELQIKNFQQHNRVSNHLEMMELGDIEFVRTMEMTKAMAQMTKSVVEIALTKQNLQLSDVQVDKRNRLTLLPTRDAMVTRAELIERGELAEAAPQLPEKSENGN